jgi:hypothetical protein
VEEEEEEEERSQEEEKSQEEERSQGGRGRCERVPVMRVSGFGGDGAAGMKTIVTMHARPLPSGGWLGCGS